MIYAVCFIAGAFAGWIAHRFAMWTWAMRAADKQRPIIEKMLFPALLILIGSSVFAGDRCNNQHVVYNQYVVDQFAVPVAVPVSPYATYFYSASPAQQQAYTSPPPDEFELFARRLAPYLNRYCPPGQAAQPQQAPPQQLTAVAKNCASCHSADHADGRPKFGSSAELTCEQRVAAIRAVVEGVMPKGGKLSDQERGKVIEDLVSKTDKPPAPQPAAPTVQPTPAPPEVPPPPPDQTNTAP